jgi:carboxyl-terminal processing protease
LPVGERVHLALMITKAHLLATALLALLIGVAAAHLVERFFEPAARAVTGTVKVPLSREESFDLGSLASITQPPVSIASTASEQELALHLAEVIAKVRREYVDEVPLQEWVERSLRSLVGSLDKHSAYLDANEHEAVLRNVAGHYPGVGIEVKANNGRIKILRILANSPAERAGLRPDDEILTIDDQPVASDASSAVAQMRGPMGTLVGMTVRRAQGGELVELALERTQVDVKSVSVESLGDSLGYIRIHSFSDTTPTDFLDAVVTLKSSVDSLNGVVLDLRDNPGGVLESATAVADALLEQGVIVAAHGRASESVFEMTAEPGDVLQGIPLMVLINGNSASAAEILAGALQDHGRATLVGGRSYGKGSVQSVIPLTDGRAIKLTTSRYMTPSGRQIQAEGIEPDILLESAEMDSASLQLDPTVQIAMGELRRGGRSKRTRTAEVPATSG